MAQGYRQKFGKRKAIKYRKYADDITIDFARCEDKAQQSVLLRLRDLLITLADRCDPSDPYDGL